MNANKSWTRGARTSVAVVAVLIGSVSLASSYTYTPTAIGGDNWSTSANWSAPPSSGVATELRFVPNNATVIAAGLVNASVNDIATGLGSGGGFLLNALTLQGTGPASGTVPTITTTGTALEFAANGSITPVVNLNALKGTVGLTYTINNNLILDTNTTFQGLLGTATFNFGGNLGGVGKLMADGTAVSFSGGTFTHQGGTSLAGKPGSTAAVMQSNITGVPLAFGSGTSMAVNNATLGLGTVGSGLTGGQSMNVSGYDVTFKGQNTISLKKGSGSGVTFAANTLTPAAPGSVMCILPSATNTLGVTEKVTVAVNAPAVVNGMVATNYVDTRTISFLTYDAVNGFVDAAPSIASTNVSGAGVNDVVYASGIVSMVPTGNSYAYAAILNSLGRYATSPSIDGTLNVGAGGVILEVSQIKNDFGGSGTIDFGANPGYLGAFVSPATQGATFVDLKNAYIAGTGGLFVYGNTQLRLDQPQTSFTGGLTIAGTLTLNNNNGAHFFNATTPNPLTILRSGQMVYPDRASAGDTTFASIAGDGLVTVDTTHANIKNMTLAGGTGTGTNEFSGRIVGGYAAGPFQLIKSGTTAQIFSGNNDFVGSTTISGGTLLINGSLGGGSTVSVTGGTLGGTGTIGGATTVATAGAIAPGMGAGTLTLTNGLTLNGHYAYQAGDLVEITGALNLSAANSALDLDGALDPYKTYTIARYTAGLTGNFHSVAPSILASHAIVYGPATGSGSIQLVSTAPARGTAVILR